MSFSIPPTHEPSSSQEGAPLKRPRMDIYGLDAKVYQLAAERIKPSGFLSTLGLGTKFVAVRVAPEKEIYVKLDDLARVTGIAKSEIESKTSKEVAKMIERHNYIVSEVAELTRSLGIPKPEAHAASLAKFAVHQLKGREAPVEVIEKLKTLTAVALGSTLRAAATGASYVGKKGSEPSLLISEGNVYISGRKLGSGTSTKVSELSSLSTDTFAGAKAVARGERVGSLEKQLNLAEILNKLGVRNITPVHRMKLYTTTKAGLPKLVALVNRLDGDGKRLIDFKVSAIHVCRVLMDVADALGDMHEKGYVHSDVKSANILLRGNPSRIPLVDSEGQLHSIGGVLHDFGGTDKTGSVISDGTELYAAPEIMVQIKEMQTRQIPLSIKIKPDQDAFAFGVTMLEMVSTEALLDTNISFGEATSDSQIQERLNEIRHMLMHVSTLEPADKLLRLEMIDIAEQCMKVKPEERMSSRQASAQVKTALLTNLEDRLQSRVDQKLLDIAAKLPSF